jgi:E3 ubiquitin-protein ligase NEDD4
VIKDFFKLLRSFDNETRTKFLFWATGSTRIPSTGFKDLRGGGETRLFNITTGGTTDHLPQAHACFNRIDLPRYTSYDMLERKIRLAMTESSGFERE